MPKAESSTLKSTLWNRLKIFLTTVPAFALVLACEYYFIFFRNFEGLDLHVLTVGDYINKSVEFIPLAAYACLIFLWTLWSYPPRFQNESEEDHYKRIGGTKEIWNKVDKSYVRAMKIYFPLLIVFMFIWVPTYLLSSVIPIFLLIYLVPFLQQMSKHFPKKLSEIVFSGPSFIVLFSVAFSIVFVFSSAQIEASTLRSDFDNADSVLVDIIDAGYLQKSKDRLVLSDKNWQEIANIEISELDERNFGCKAGIKILCFGEKNIELEDKPKNDGDVVVEE